MVSSDPDSENSDDIDYTPKTQKGVPVVETEREYHWFLPAMKCSDCEEREGLIVVTEPQQSERMVETYADEAPTDFEDDWEGVIFCTNCGQLGVADLTNETLLEHTVEEWNEYLQKRQKYGLDL